MATLLTLFYASFLGQTKTGREEKVLEEQLQIIQQEKAKVDQDVKVRNLQHVPEKCNAPDIFYIKGSYILKNNSGMT